MKTKRLIIIILTMAMTLGLHAQRTINIFGVVRDKVRLMPVQGANVIFMDENSIPIFNGKTNQDGYFIIETNLTPGRKILIKISKENLAEYSVEYYIKDRENYLEVFLEPGISDQKIGISIKDKRGKNLAGAVIDFESEGRRMTGGETDENGYFLLQHKFVPGQPVIIHVSKGKYKTREITHIYSRNVDDNSITIILKKDTKLKPGYKVSLAGGGLLLIAGTAKLISNKKHDTYLEGPANFSSFEERESTYQSANTWNKVAAYTFDAGALAVAGGLSWVWFFNKTEDENEPRRPQNKPARNTNFYSGIGYDPANNSVMGGIRLTF